MLASNIGLHGHTDTLGVIRLVLQPPAMGPNETVTQVVVAPALRVDDYVWATPAATFTGTCLVGAFVALDGQIELTWLNTDNQSVTPAAVPTLLFFLRGPRVDADLEQVQQVQPVQASAGPPEGVPYG
jgi:hypothetical protein